VLAGGRGTRLKPFTFAFPKPLVPIGDTPILDIIVQQLRASGVTRITMGVGHLAELIMAYFEHARFRDIAIDYCREAEPLGTAGPLTLADNIDERFLVLNGDILTSLDLADLVRHHVDAKALATIASYRKEVTMDLGVLDVDEHGELRAYVEKPTQTYMVSMGVYVFEPDVLGFLERGEHCDLPTLIGRILSSGKKLCVYPFSGHWLDIGRPDDYARAIDEFEAFRPEFLPSNGPVVST
jgi:NDP-sugar pyrophosphorylase family protein